jgi:short-subunit dehydrogenase
MLKIFVYNAILSIVSENTSQINQLAEILKNSFRHYRGFNRGKFVFYFFTDTINNTMKKAIIIGASSGIGRELSRIMARDGFMVGLVARRVQLLNNINNEFPKSTFIKQIDINDYKNAILGVNDLINKMGGVDIFVISAGIGFLNKELQLENEIKTIDTNITGFTAMANVAFRHFTEKKQGHLVVITSIAAIRGARQCPAYNASKAFQSNYIEGLRQNVFHLNLPITITEIRPGFVDTAMAQGDNLFWVASPQEAAKQIYNNILRKNELAYITRRWRLIAWLFRLVPMWIHKRM